MAVTSYASYEIRKWFRDSFSVFMLGYFLMMGIIGRYLVPVVGSRFPMPIAPYYPAVLAALVIFASRIIAGVAAFSLLDDRDDNVLLAVKVAPMSLEAFIGVKMGLIYLISLGGGVFVLWFSQLVELSLGTMLTIAAVTALGSPIFALLINCVASNKIEGFAAIKGLNIFVILPVVALFIRGNAEFAFAFEPSFWPVKALAVAIGSPVTSAQLSYGTYLGVGTIYSLAVLAAVYTVFKRRA